ncbi:MAG: hypothetical protein MZW92_29620 [Comamonadaceae bacterium]|nr:hypothetical protein [Comamonadaceae bacterium]
MEVAAQGYRHSDLRDHRLALACLAVWLAGRSGPELQGWLELANGATWPDERWSSKACCTHPVTFSVVVGTRTALNFAGPVAVVGTAIWALSGGLERLMQMSRSEHMHFLAAELVSALTSVVRKETHVSDSLFQEMSRVAHQAVDSHLGDVEDLENAGKQDSDSR